MICARCREGRHAGCANLRKPQVTLPNWCDCQHRPGTSTPPAGDDRPGAAHGETSPAALHVPA